MFIKFKSKIRKKVNRYILKLLIEATAVSTISLEHGKKYLILVPDVMDEESIEQVSKHINRMWTNKGQSPPDISFVLGIPKVKVLEVKDKELS